MKTKYKSFKGVLITGTNEVSIPHDLDAGEVVVACLFAGTPSKETTIKILDTGGSAIIEPSSYKDWEQRQGGTYITSKKPMNFQGGQKVRVVVNSIENQTTDWNFEVLLIIQQ